MTYDSALHFYNMDPKLSSPQMIVVADLEDLFLPLPDDILVNLQESSEQVISLLDQIPGLFREAKNESCLGSAIKGAFMAMKHIGGKMLVFSACLPTLGEGALRAHRDNPRLLGTEKEIEILRPQDESYKDLAQKLVYVQISVDVFVAPKGMSFCDLATIRLLSLLIKKMKIDRNSCPWARNRMLRFPL